MWCLLENKVSTLENFKNDIWKDQVGVSSGTLGNNLFGISSSIVPSQNTFVPFAIPTLIIGKSELVAIFWRLRMIGLMIEQLNNS